MTILHGTSLKGSLARQGLWGSVRRTLQLSAASTALYGALTGGRVLRRPVRDPSATRQRASVRETRSVHTK